MMPAAKHGDPQMGVDIHLCVVPPSPSPVPLPTPHMSIVFDPFDYVPHLGATVTVCGMKRAVAGTAGKAVHIPPGFPFAPKIPDTDDELFMGSATVVADGDPFSFLAVPVLGCQVSGMPSPPRVKQQEKKLMLLPTTVNVAIPTNVFVGGPPTISLMGMAFKFGFAALGKFAKSNLFKKMRQKLFGKMKSGFLKCIILRAEPVDITTGEVSVEHEDFKLPGRIPIQWVRSYTSNNRRKGACGWGWETPADIRLEIVPEDGSAIFLRPGGPAALFPKPPDAEGHDAAVLEVWDGALLSDHGSEFQVRTKEDLVYHFDKAPASIGKDGVREYLICRISDLCDNWLVFERRGRRLVRICESAGRQIEVTTEGDLIRRVALYVPDTEFKHIFAEYDYSGDGDLIEVRDALGSPYRFAYDEHHMSGHTDRTGLSFWYEYEKTVEGWRVIHTWGNEGLYEYQFRYLHEISEVQITDSLGFTSSVTLDARRLPISELDPLGGVTIYEYDDVGRTTAVIDQDGRRTEYEYDERGNLLKLTRPDGSLEACEYNPDNKAIATTDANGSQWRQKWNARGLLTMRVSPLGNTSIYEYDSHGKPVSFVSPRGHCHQLYFDVLGNLLVLKDELGHSTYFAYDSLGNVTAVTDPFRGKTQYTYDANSRPTSVCSASGIFTQYVLDAEGRVARYVDGNGAETRLEYFGQGEIARHIQPDGQVVEHIYDTEERRIGVRNQRGELYELRRDALGRIIEEIDYWGQIRRHIYTPGGHLTASIDPAYTRIDYSMDAVGRLVMKCLPGGFTEEYKYDLNGNLIWAKNDLTEISRTFDLEGQLLRETQGHNFVIEYSYDPAGNRRSRRTSLGNNVQYDHDPIDEVAAIRINSGDPIRFGREVSGRIIEDTLAPELRRRRQFDADGLLAEQVISLGEVPLAAVQYQYDNIGNLKARADIHFGDDTYDFDALGRVLQYESAGRRPRAYAYDPAGDRLTTHTIGFGMEMEAGSEKRSGLRFGSCDDNKFTFDPAGNLIERADDTGDLHLTWNADRRLIESSFNGMVTDYGYDPVGRRIHKQTGDLRTHFFWDNDTLVAETVVNNLEPNGVSSSREYLYYDRTYEPLAVIVREGATIRTAFYQNDPNGCPIRLISKVGTTLWSASFDAFGYTQFEMGFADKNYLRFQGQYYDVETGLHYNRSRYYEPRLGTFISQDPLGIFAGDNLYLYGPNTLVWIDPLGLACKAIALGLDPFFKNLPGVHWKNWAREGVTRRTVTNRFGRAFHEATDRASHIHFALDHIGESAAAIEEAVRRGKAGFSVATRNMTNAELHHIVDNPELFAKTTFYKGGKECTAEQVSHLFAAVR